MGGAPLDWAKEGSRFRVQGSRFKVVVAASPRSMTRSQLFWHSLSLIRRFSPLRMTKRGDARKWWG